MKKKPTGGGSLDLRPLNRYRVTGYHSGDFVGVCEFVTAHFAGFSVLDPLASSTLTEGAVIEVPKMLAKFELVQE